MLLTIKVSIICDGQPLTLIAKFMGPTSGPPASCRPHVGPMHFAFWVGFVCQQMDMTSNETLETFTKRVKRHDLTTYITYCILQTSNVAKIQTGMIYTCFRFYMADMFIMQRKINQRQALRRPIMLSRLQYQLRVVLSLKLYKMISLMAFFQSNYNPLIDRHHTNGLLILTNIS